MENNNLITERWNICKQCPLYSNGICNNKLWLNIETGDVSIVEKFGYKRGCGCSLKYKIPGPFAKCPLGKW